MKYPYYNPHLRFIDVLKAFFISKKKAESRIKDYFRSLTGKRYILITNSCRSALYLAYKAAGIDGKEIITSPLTCKVAIDPIKESGNSPVFADIDPGDLNIKSADIEHRITTKTKAIQAIHLGGVSCEMGLINKIAKKHNLWVIEDCAQALGAKYNDHYAGSFGNVACFSLIKNAYGIGGGILATDSKEIYEKAIDYCKNWKATSLKLLTFRMIRCVMETHRQWYSAAIALKMLMKVRGNRKSYHTVKCQLKRISRTELKISAVQIRKFNCLHQNRKNAGKEYYQQLTEANLLTNKNYDPNSSSFTKFFVYRPQLDSKETITKLAKEGIEAMHLEHRQASPVQEKLIDKEDAIKQNLKNYLKVHDNIVSLPLCERFSLDDIKFIRRSLPQ